MFAMKFCRVASVVFVTAMLSGCYFGRSSIRTSDGGTYDIYNNGRYICSTDGDCSVTTRGAFGSTIFEAQKNGTTVGERSISRDITLASVLWMPFTYCLSIFIYQAYPDEIVIPVDAGKIPRSEGSPWRESEQETPASGNAGGSVWERPIY